MEYRKLSTTGLDVSKICLGTMNFGQQNTEEDAHEQLDYATSNGVNFIDTAEIYPIPPEPELQGTTERYVGSWLKKSGKREELIVASKVAPSPIIRTRDISDALHLDRKSIREAIEGSLLRLNTDYLDLYQVHFPERQTNTFGVRGYSHYENDNSTPVEETLEALDELVKEGKTRFIGVSNETPWGVMEYLKASKEKSLARIVSIQNQYSLLNRTFEIGLAEISIKESVDLLAYSPLSMGVLTGKYLGGAKPEGARFTLSDRSKARYNAESAQEAISKYVEVAKKYNLDPAQMAIAFVNEREFVTSNIIGATSMEQLKIDIDAAELVLSEEVLEDIDKVYKMYPDPTC